MLWSVYQLLLNIAVDVHYLWIPLIVAVLLSVLLYFMKVEKANAEWDEEHLANK